jgi:SAM-dependent methyltransferase
MRGEITNPAAFDAFADNYDDAFTQSLLSRLLRPRVWEKLAAHFKAGQHVLELACGTGEDAVWLAKRGMRVTVTDGSAKMIEAARAKAEAAGLAGQITAAQLSWQEIINGNLGGQRSTVGGHQFDGIYSNFGGLNTIGAWAALAERLAAAVRLGGKLILVPMGPVCPWEIVWHLLHGQPRVAFRRFGRTTVAKIGDTTIPIWYPSAGQLRRAFGPWFRHLKTESLGLWLPPSYLDHFVNRWPDFFARLGQFEKRTAHLTQSWGDHYIIIFERND